MSRIFLSIAMILLVGIYFPAHGQYKFWESQRILHILGDNIDPIIGKKYLKIYKYKSDKTSKIKIVNNSCFDVTFKFKVSYLNVSGGSSIYTKRMEGVIAKGQTKYYSKYVGNTKYIRLDEFEDGNMISMARVTQPEDVWSRDIVVLKCLGYNSTEQYKAAKKRYHDKEKKILADKNKKNYERNKKIADQKTKKWIDKGIKYHITHYNKQRKKSFYMGVPLDSLEMISKYESKYLLVINPRPFPLKSVINDKYFIYGELKKFMTSKVTPVMLSPSENSAFWKFVKAKKLNIQQTPVAVLFDPNGVPIGIDYGVSNYLLKDIPNYLREVQNAIKTFEAKKK